MAKIDTSMEGFEYVGIKLTEQQYEDLCDLNIALMNEDRKYIPVFNTMVLLKILGLLPEEMLIESNTNSGENTSDSREQYHRKFGRPRE